MSNDGKRLRFDIEDRNATVIAGRLDSKYSEWACELSWWSYPDSAKTSTRKSKHQKGDKRKFSGFRNKAVVRPQSRTADDDDPMAIKIRSVSKYWDFDRKYAILAAKNDENRRKSSVLHEILYSFKRRNRRFSDNMNLTLNATTVLIG